MLELAITNFRDKFGEWLDKSVDITDGYDYESSYVKFLQEVGKDTLILSIGSVPKSKNKRLFDNFCKLGKNL